MSEDTVVETDQPDYLQCLGAFKGDAGFLQKATRSYALARFFNRTSPTVEFSCHFLIETRASPCVAVRKRAGRRSAP
ncbi:MAG: hypothetical protein AAGA74_10630 [Pseudomonadota bacterium]